MAIYHQSNYYLEKTYSQRFLMINYYLKNHIHTEILIEKFRFEFSCGLKGGGASPQNNEIFPRELFKFILFSIVKKFNIPFRNSMAPP